MTTVRRPRTATSTSATRVRWTLVAAAVIAAGCHGPDESAAPAARLATVFDTVGTWVRVSNSGAAPEWNLTLVASIGPGPDMGEATPGDFGEAVSVALDPGEDEVYVVDRQNCRISVFGVDGIHRRTFGRCGEGPGEFSPFFYSIAWAGDKLLAFDFGGGRIGEFTADGEWLGQRKVLGMMGGGWTFALYPAGSGHVYAMSLTGGHDDESNQFGGRRLASAYLGHAAAGETADTVFPLSPPETSGNVTCEWGEGYLGFFANPYAARFLQHPAAGGTLYSAMSDEYRVVVTRGSDTLRVIKRELAPEPVSDEEWDALSDQFGAWLDDKPGASCKPRSPGRPSAKPFLEGVFFDVAGRLWVEVARTGGNRWELFDAEGRLLAQMPAGKRKKAALPALGAGHVATIRQDSLDLDHVDIWRIEAPTR